MLMLVYHTYFVLFGIPYFEEKVVSVVDLS